MSKLAQRQAVKRRKLLLIKLDMLKCEINFASTTDIVGRALIFQKYSCLADLYHRVAATPAKIMRADKFGIDKRRSRRYSLTKKGITVRINYGA